MDSYDNVKAEKAYAIARYRRFRNLAKLLQIIEVFVALTLISWLWIHLPAAMKISGDALSDLSLYILNPHFIFLVGNVIVIALFLLSRHYDAGNNSNNNTDPYSNDFLPYTDGFPSVPAVSYSEFPSAEIAAEKEATIKLDKQIVCAKDDVVCKMQCEEAVTSAIEKATKQIQKFQRSQSAKQRCEIDVKPRAELRRSETERKKIVVKSDERRPLETSVESLSNEEFRLTIEAFIAKQQKFIWAQKMAENEK